tara:strand:+ start:4138 stop:4716 length:579 start_codon:yes stop_codon:yes gene_type:complete
MAYNSTTWTTEGATTSVSSANLTLYADFFTNNIESATYLAGTHYMLSRYNKSTAAENPHLSDGSDPATSFTLSSTTLFRGGQLVPHLLYLPDNIYIDAVYSIEGADAATGDTTRMHLMSFDYTSNSTSVLTNGTLLAHNSDVTNGGQTKTHLSTWTVDSASVSSGKVIVATFEADTVNSDYTINVKVKYHLT